MHPADPTKHTHPGVGPVSIQKFRSGLSWSKTGVQMSHYLIETFGPAGQLLQREKEKAYEETVVVVRKGPESLGNPGRLGAVRLRVRPAGPG